MVLERLEPIEALLAAGGGGLDDAMTRNLRLIFCGDPEYTDRDHVFRARDQRFSRRLGRSTTTSSKPQFPLHGRSSCF